MFLKFLKDEDPSIQAMALRGLFKLKEPPPMEDAPTLAKNRNIDVRKYLCLSLQFHRNPEVIPLLTGLQKDQDFNVRFDASEALKRLDKETVRKLSPKGKQKKYPSD
jgi:HEAT repeat protein